MWDHPCGSHKAQDDCNGCIGLMLALDLRCQAEVCNALGTTTINMQKLSIHDLHYQKSLIFIIQKLKNADVIMGNIFGGCSGLTLW